VPYFHPHSSLSLVLRLGVKNPPSCITFWWAAGATMPAQIRWIYAGFSDALLLDNGGDVLLWRRSLYCDEPLDLGGPGAVIPSSLGRECWAGLIAYLTLPSDPHVTCETFLATCEPTVALQMHASLSLTEVNVD
jgi:hypothetical protein